MPNNLSRFLNLSPINEKHYIAFIDDVIRHNLSFIFKGYEVINCYSVKLNRDQDTDLENTISSDIIEQIRAQIEKRKVGVPTRFLYDHSMPDHMLRMLVRKLNLKSKDLVPGGRYHNMDDLMSLPNPLGDELKAQETVSS